MQIDPYYWQQECNQVTLDSGSAYADIHGVPLGVGIKWQWGCRWQQFLVILVATSSETLAIMPSKTICYALLAC